MEESDRDTLRKNRQVLLKDMEAKKVASRLYSRSIFSEEDKDEVNSKSTPNEQGEYLLDTLSKRGPRAFRAFCDVLHELSPHLESLLRPVQEAGTPSEGTDGGNKTPISSTSNLAASEKDDSTEHKSIDSKPSSSMSDGSLIYRMNRSPRGIAVIINNKTFLESSGQHMSPRQGTDVDRDALKKLFQKLQFKVEIHNNITKREIRNIAAKMASFDHSSYDAFIFTILTHGEEGLVYGTDGTISITDITSKFKSNVSLAGKPKIFLFQACQGQEFMEGLDVPDGPQPVETVSVPVEADFLYAYSTVPGPPGINNDGTKVPESADEADAKLFGFGGGSGSAKPSSSTLDKEIIYKMDRSTRGIAVIINNKNFLRSSGMDRYPRNGTDVDRDSLARLFKMLKFDVKVYNDRTKAEIRTITKEMATLNHSNYDAFIFSILTHGEEGVIYGTDGTFSIRDLTAEFKYSSSLAGKPKLFFFQACQGHEYMDGMDVTDAPQENKVSVPAEADFLYAYSTVPGYYSWRNSVNGSWFIQSLTKVFEDNADRMDILRMLTRVNAMVSTYKSRTGDYYSDSKRQVSSIVSMLRKELYFFPENIVE